jgi:hypothetical protein
MRVTWALGVGAVLAACVGLAQLASAQTPTPTGGPTDTPVPTASPSPTPYQGPPSTITIRFVSGGQPVSITLASPVNSISADGVQCSVAVTGLQVIASGYSIDWPLPPGASQPAPCSKDPPTSVMFEFLSGDFGTLSTTVQWAGQNVTQDIEVPLPVSQPASTPAQLPGTGGQASPDAWLPARASAGLGVLLCAIAVVALLLRLRQPPVP